MKQSIASDSASDHGPRSFISRVHRKLRKVMRQGFRQHLRRRVALTSPSPKANQALEFSPHCLTCHQDLLLAVCSAKSLNLAVGQSLPWVFHEDGSLSKEDKQLLHFHFPGCRLIERAEADESFTSPALHGIAEARKRSVLLMKIADVHVFARHERILFVDSDVLFFQKPEALLKVLTTAERNYFSKDIQTAYISDLDTLQSLTNVRALERVNSGIFAVNRSDISLDAVCRRLSELQRAKAANEVLYNHLIEQTLFAILTSDSASGVSHLPSEYDLHLGGLCKSAVCRHYVGVIRESFELEGLRMLLSRENFLRRWEGFSTAKPGETTHQILTRS